MINSKKIQKMSSALLLSSLILIHPSAYAQTTGELVVLQAQEELKKAQENLKNAEALQLRKAREQADATTPSISSDQEQIDLSAYMVPEAAQPEAKVEGAPSPDQSQERRRPISGFFRAIGRAIKAAPSAVVSFVKGTPGVVRDGAIELKDDAVAGGKGIGHLASEGAGKVKDGAEGAGQLIAKGAVGAKNLAVDGKDKAVDGAKAVGGLIAEGAGKINDGAVRSGELIAEGAGKSKDGAVGAGHLIAKGAGGVGHLVAEGAGKVKDGVVGAGHLISGNDGSEPSAVPAPVTEKQVEKKADDAVAKACNDTQSSSGSNKLGVAAVGAKNLLVKSVIGVKNLAVKGAIGAKNLTVDGAGKTKDGAVWFGSLAKKDGIKIKDFSSKEGRSFGNVLVDGGVALKDVVLSDGRKLGEVTVRLVKASGSGIKNGAEASWEFVDEQGHNLGNLTVKGGKKVGELSVEAWGGIKHASIATLNFIEKPVAGNFCDRNPEAKQCIEPAAKISDAQAKAVAPQPVQAAGQDGSICLSQFGCDPFASVPN